VPPQPLYTPFQNLSFHEITKLHCNTLFTAIPENDLHCCKGNWKFAVYSSLCQLLQPLQGGRGEFITNHNLVKKHIGFSHTYHPVESATVVIPSVKVKLLALEQSVSQKPGELVIFHTLYVLIRTRVVLTRWPDRRQNGQEQSNIWKVAETVKVKVKLSLCLFLTEHHTMKAYWGNGGIAPFIPRLRH
jgi:hypothetical protein